MIFFFKIPSFGADIFKKNFPRRNSVGTNGFEEEELVEIK
jgi:hypothetical protein